MTTPQTSVPPGLKSSDISEEQKFKNKFPGKMPASTDFLRKRIQKGVKYFDSGEYNMAKSNNRSGQNSLLGKAIPTPEAVAQRKHSTASKSNLVDREELSPSPTDEKTFAENIPEQQTREEEEEKK